MGITKLFCNGANVMQRQGSYRNRRTLVMSFKETVIFQEFEKADYQILTGLPIE